MPVIRISAYKEIPKTKIGKVAQCDVRAFPTENKTWTGQMNRAKLEMEKWEKENPAIVEFRVLVTPT